MSKNYDFVSKCPKTSLATMNKKPALPPAKHENKAAGRYSNGSERSSVGVFPKCRLQKVEKYCIDEKP